MRAICHVPSGVVFRGTLSLDAQSGGAWWRPLVMAGLWFQVRLWPSRDIRSGGSYINTASWPPSLTPGAPHVSSVLWPSGHKAAELHRLIIRCHLQRDRYMTRQTGCQRSSIVCNVVPSQWLWPSAGLAWLRLTLSLKPWGGIGCMLGFIAGKLMGRVPAVACH